MDKAKTLKRARRILARAAGAKVIKAKMGATDTVTLPTPPWEYPAFKSVRGKGKRT